MYYSTQCPKCQPKKETLVLVGSLSRSLITGSESVYSAIAAVFSTVVVVALAAVAEGFFLTTYATAASIAALP